MHYGISHGRLDVRLLHFPLAAYVVKGKEQMMAGAQVGWQSYLNLVVKVRIFIVVRDGGEVLVGHFRARGSAEYRGQGLALLLPAHQLNAHCDITCRARSRTKVHFLKDVRASYYVRRYYYGRPRPRASKVRPTNLMLYFGINIKQVAIRKIW
jgi:hypothetical protein